MSDESPAGHHPGPDPRGIPCRHCGAARSRVIYTRRYDGKIVRRRECAICGRRMTTTERAT